MNSMRRIIAAERRRLLTLYPISILQRNPFHSIPPTLEASNSFAGDGVQKESVAWPKPREIPWQAKVVNSVNLIGQIKKPVQFIAYPDGKTMAGTIISNEDHPSDSSTSSSFCIPVIFEGDLAQNVARHLREKDCVHVAGHLSVDVSPFNLSKGHPNTQVMAHSINLVDSSPPSRRSKLEERTAKSDAWRDLVNNPKQWVDNRQKKCKGLVKAKYPDFRHKDTEVGLWLKEAPSEVLQALGQLEFYAPPSQAAS